MCSNARIIIRFSVQILILYCVIFKQLSNALSLSELYPFGSNNGDTKTERTDDGGSGQINLNSTFKFFGRNYTKLYVNNNGILTFDSELTEYKPEDFPPSRESDNHPIIAPFWADVDTKRIPNGDVWYRQTNNATLLERASAEIRSYFIEQRLFKATWMLIATWEDVGFFGAAGVGKTKRNTFQAILITNEKRSFAIFNYFKIVWTTGSNSGGNTQTGLGGSPAQAGFNAGDGKNYFSIEGAQTAAVINFTLTSNVGIPGKWVFRVDGKSVEDVKCHHAVQIKLHPQSASMLGGEEIRVSGPCFNLDFRVYARIYETNITFPCTVLNDVTASCVTPTIFRTGEVTFQLNPYDLGWNYSSVFSLVNLADMVPGIHVDLNKQISWNPADIPSNDSRIELLQYKVDTFNRSELNRILIDEISVAEGMITGLSFNTKPSWSTAMLRISWNSSENSNSLPVSIWSRPFPVSFEMDYSKQWCKNWTKLESEKLNLTGIYSDCPCRLNQALQDTGRFNAGPFCHLEKINGPSNCIYRKEATHCVHQNLQSGRTSGDICCYDSSGELIDIRNGLGGGHRTRYHYRAQGENIVPYFSYFQEDQLPYFHCCQNSEDNDLCLTFIQYRPPTTCQSYAPPTPAQAAGDPHISTLDGRDYTFNGIGDFVLVQDTNLTVVIQVRTQQAKDTSGASQNASVFSGIAISAPGFSDIIEVHKPEVNDDEDVRIVVNGQNYVMASSSAQLNGVILYKSTGATNTLRVVLASVGISVSIDILPDLLNLLVMVGENRLKGKLRGLLGNFNGNNEDDFISRNDTVISFNSSMETLHFDFGMTWKVSELETLFSDSLISPESDISRSDSFVPSFVDKIDSSELRNGTLELCGDVVQCIFDFQVTGNKDLAKSTLNAVEKFKSIQEDVKKVVRCPFVSTPESGNKSVTGYSPGDLASFQCLKGFTVIGGDETRICQDDGSWSGLDLICAVPIAKPEDDTRNLLYIAVGSGSGGAVVLFIVICLVICCKCQKKDPPVEVESPLDLPTIFPPSNIPCRVFENEAFMTSLQQLSAGGTFKIPRPSYVDPTIFDEYFF